MGPVDTASAETGFAADERQYLTVRLGDEEHGVEILAVQEIKGYSAITPVPNAPGRVTSSRCSSTSSGSSWARWSSRRRAEPVASQPGRTER